MLLMWVGVPSNQWPILLHKQSYLLRRYISCRSRTWSSFSKCSERSTLTELGYPQPTTTIFVDNTVAEGLATDTINAKRSKSMDVSFFWLRDRIKKLQFFIRHIKGKWNIISDFFRKPLPKDKFEQFSHSICCDQSRSQHGTNASEAEHYHYG